jgi:hypothetical protein
MPRNPHFRRANGTHCVGSRTIPAASQELRALLAILNASSIAS